MFDLEQAISDWRRAMSARGVKTPEVLDELESHLRDGVDRLTRAGTNPQRAFEAAIYQFGQPKVLQEEFKKVERSPMKKIMIITAGVICIMVGPGFIVPALAKHNNEHLWNGEVVVPLMLGIIIILLGVATATAGFKRRTT